MAQVPYITDEEAQTLMLREDPTGAVTGITSTPVTEDEIWVASKDLDDYALGFRNASTNEGLKLLPSDHEVWIQDELKRAVCKQIAYRRRNGPAFFVEAQYESVSGNGISRKGQLPKLSPEARSILSRAGLMQGAGGVRSDANYGVLPVARVAQPLFPWARRRRGL